MRRSPSKVGGGDRDGPMASACNGLVSMDRERDGMSCAISEFCELVQKAHAPEGPTRPLYPPAPKLDLPGRVDSGLKAWRSTSVCSPLRLQRSTVRCGGGDQLLANSQGVQLKKAKERSKKVSADYLGSAVVVKPVLQAHALRAYHCGCVVLWPATRELAP
jgi:hypothetical protein